MRRLSLICLASAAGFVAASATGCGGGSSGGDSGGEAGYSFIGYGGAFQVGGAQGFGGAPVSGGAPAAYGGAPGFGGAVPLGGAPAGLGGAATICTPGETQACVGPGACSGAQVCNADGMGWGACDCGTGTGGAAPGAGGTPGTGGVGGVAPGGAPGVGGQIVTAGQAGMPVVTAGAAGTAGTAGAPVVVAGGGGVAGSAGGPVVVAGGGGMAGAGGAATDLDFAYWEFFQDLSGWDADPYGGNVDGTATWTNTGDTDDICADSGCISFEVPLCQNGDNEAFTFYWSGPQDLTGQTLSFNVYVTDATAGGIQVGLAQGAPNYETAMSSWVNLSGVVDTWTLVEFDLATTSGVDLTAIEKIFLQVHTGTVSGAGGAGGGGGAGGAACSPDVTNPTVVLIDSVELRCTGDCPEPGAGGAGGAG